MFAPLTSDENKILGAHLTSGWYKQSAVYPVLSEPWQETDGFLNDLHAAWTAAFEASEPPPRRKPSWPSRNPRPAHELPRRFSG